MSTYNFFNACSEIGITIARIALLQFLSPRQYYNLLYLLKYTSWDTQKVPREIDELIKLDLSCGSFLDIGCGTGTNAIYLAQNGWIGTGIDISDLAIKAAQKELFRRGLENKVTLVRTNFEDWNPDKQYDLALDIGCFTGLSQFDQLKYSNRVAAVLRNSCQSTQHGGLLLLFSFPPRKIRGKIVGIHPEEVDILFKNQFNRIYRKDGIWNKQPAHWHLFMKKSQLNLIAR